MQTIPETSLREPTIAVYYAVLLAAAGEREKAGPYFGAAEKAPMLPEERQPPVPGAIGINRRVSAQFPGDDRPIQTLRASITSQRAGTREFGADDGA
jgi:hypothetical protein